MVLMGARWPPATPHVFHWPSIYYMSTDFNVFSCPLLFLFYFIFFYYCYCYTWEFFFPSSFSLYIYIIIIFWSVNVLCLVGISVFASSVSCLSRPPFWSRRRGQPLFFN